MTEDLYRKYLESVVKVMREKLLSSETNMIHYSQLSDIDGMRYAESVPLRENILYVLILLRTKQQAAVVEARSRLEQLMLYQNIDGSFPVTVTEFGRCSDWDASLHILLMLCEMIEQYSIGIGEEAELVVKKRFDNLFLWCQEIVAAEQDQKSSFSLLRALLFTAVAHRRDPSNEKKKKAFFSIASKVEKAYDLLFDMKSCGYVLSALSTGGAYDMSLRLLQRLSHMWSPRTCFRGPPCSSLQSGESPAVMLGDVILSLFLNTPLFQKVDNWPYATVAAFGMIPPYFFQNCGPVDAAFQELQESYGFWIHSEKDVALSWMYFRVQKPASFPLKVTGKEWSCVLSSAEYRLAAVEKKGMHDGKMLFACRFEKEPSPSEEEERGKPFVLFSLYIEKKELAGVCHPDGTMATYFEPGEFVRIGSLEGDDHILLLQEHVLSSMRLRAGHRPGQIKVGIPHILRERGLPFQPGCDWVVDAVLIGTIKPSDIFLSLYV